MDPFRPSASYAKDLENTSNISLPLSYLADLANDDIPLPYVFELRHPENEKTVFASVCGFDAPRNHVALPPWMMEHLCADEGDTIEVKPIQVPLGTSVKIEPQHTDFSKIVDVEGTLMRVFGDYPVVTRKAKIPFTHQGIAHEILIVETVPDTDAIYAVNTNLEVDLMPPKVKRMDIAPFVFPRGKDAPQALRLPPGMLFFGYPKRTESVLK